MPCGSPDTVASRRGGLTGPIVAEPRSLWPGAAFATRRTSHSFPETPVHVTTHPSRNALRLSVGLIIAAATSGRALGTPPGSTAAIDEAALATKRTEYLYRRDGKVFLYGQRTNGADTQGGSLACAKVVSIVLRQAGVNMGVELGVAGVERALGSWQRVTAERELRPGDVVVWTNRFRGNRNGACTGGGTCHVGIVTSDGYFHNDPLGDGPTFDGLGLLPFRFKVGFRPP